MNTEHRRPIGPQRTGAHRSLTQKASLRASIYRISLPSGPTGTGTRFEIGGIDFRYANIAFKSSAGSFAYQFHGIGGRIGRDVPMCLPDWSAFTNNSSVQTPRPVFGSGVRLAAYDTPHGPLHAVRCSFVWTIHELPGSCLAAAITPTLSGCPDNILLISGSGPFGPIFFGVWQSWQPPPTTSISPRSIGDCAGASGAAA